MARRTYARILAEGLLFCFLLSSIRLASFRSSLRLSVSVACGSPGRSILCRSFHLLAACLIDASISMPMASLGRPCEQYRRLVPFLARDLRCFAPLRHVAMMIHSTIQRSILMLALEIFFEAQVGTRVRDSRYYIIPFHVYILFGQYARDLSSAAVSALKSYLGRLFSAYLRLFDPSRRANKKLHASEV